MFNSNVGEAHRILSETNVLLCAGPERADRYEAWLFDDWNISRVRTAEALRSALADIDLLVATDRTLRDGLDEVFAQRPRRREEEALLGIVVDDGFQHVDPDATLAVPLDEDEFVTTARRLRIRSAYDASLREYYSLVDCLSAMETNRASAVLENDPVYERVNQAEQIQTDRVETLRNRLLELGDDVAFATPRKQRRKSPNQ
jgi:hypothetical protein